MEKRVPMVVPVDLVIAEEMFVTERAITVNVSPHGARVVTRRRWQAEEQPWVASPSREFRIQARVVYCRPLTDGYFCVGLRLQPGFLNIGDSPWWYDLTIR